jgi:hypothetical protein
MRNVWILPFLLVAASFAQTFDANAELPRAVPPVLTQSAPNVPITVPASVGQNLQTVFTGARCGDTLVLDATLIYSGSLSLLPAGCDGNPVIVTSNSAQVDAKGRIVPGQQLPKIVLKGTQTLTLGPNVLLDAVEVTRVQGGTVGMYNLITLAAGAHDVALNRVYCHGNSTDETVRCLFITSNRNVTVTNSYFSDFHCKALGSCGDAQAIAGGISTAADSGVYLIQNNYLEGSGENIIFGGGSAQYPPCDITVQYNDLIKPATWNPAEVGYAGIPWITKNLFELKNACRVLVQGNYMYGSWGGYTQNGFAILIGAKNQGSATGGQCPLCIVNDVTVRNNWVRHAGQFAQIMLVPSGNGDWAAGEYNINVHDNVADDLQYPACSQCGQWLIQLSTSPGSPTTLHDVRIVNNSFFVPYWKRDGGFMVIGGPVAGATTPQMYNIVVQSNLAPGGKYPIYSVGGGAANCFAAGTLNYAAGLAGCWVGTSTFSANTITINGNTAKITWPANNDIVSAGASVPATQTAVQKFGAIR